MEAVVEMSKRAAQVRCSRGTRISDGGYGGGIGNDHEFFHLHPNCLPRCFLFPGWPTPAPSLPYISKFHKFFKANSDIMTDTGPPSSVSGYGWLLVCLLPQLALSQPWV